MGRTGGRGRAGESGGKTQARECQHPTHLQSALSSFRPRRRRPSPPSPQALVQPRPCSNPPQPAPAPLCPRPLAFASALVLISYRGKLDDGAGAPPGGEALDVEHGELVVRVAPAAAVVRKAGALGEEQARRLAAEEGLADGVDGGVDDLRAVRVRDKAPQALEVRAGVRVRGAHQDVALRDAGREVDARADLL